MNLSHWVAAASAFRKTFGSDGAIHVKVVSADGTAPTASTPVSAVIASAASLSAAVDLGSARLGSIYMPASVGTSTVLSFAGSSDGVTYVPIRDQYGQEYRLNNITASKTRAVDTEIFATYRYLKVRRGTEDSPNTEAVSHTYTLGLLA